MKNQNYVARRTSRMLAGPLLCLALLFLTGMTACSTKEKASTGRRYDLKGKVVSVDKANRQVTIAHEEIQDYMAAMVMPFHLKEKDDWALNVLAAGDQITATLVVDGTSSWIEDVTITKESTDKSSTDKTEGLPEPNPGDEVPDFSLVNQDGKRIRLKDYRGKTLLITFIYTRCPDPNYCTLMDENFLTIDKELQKDSTLYARTHLLSISFDPDYDTPKVLKSYGASHTGRLDKETFEHWEFATGAKEEVKSIAQFFGLRYYEETDQIVHTLRTSIITPEGKVYKVYRGNEWKPSEVISDLQALLNQKS
jgi:protein SCO1/2